MISRTCLLVEDQAEIRAWMAGLIAEAFPGIAVTQAATVREARARLADGVPPDLAVIDLGLPDGSGVDLIAGLAQDSPETLAMVATIYDDDAHLFDALSAGARGYLLKSEESPLIVGYLKRIAAGEPPLSPSIAHRILRHFQKARPASPRWDDEAGLSSRETEVLALLARGLTVAEAGASLGLKTQTVAGYVKIIYQKLNVTSRAEATLAAARRGLV